jgi:uncharacterized protein YjdB
MTLIPARVSAADYPFIILTSYHRQMNVGDEFLLIAVTSTGKQATFQSSDHSIASVNTYGVVTAKKAGTVKITAKIKNAEATCKVTVAKTTLTLNKKSISMYRSDCQKITAKVSTGHRPKWKSSKSSVATVSESGMVKALKHGTATITATVDGVSKTCNITVKQPTVTLSQSELTLNKGSSATLSAKVSSGNTPAWSSSNENVATVSSRGKVTAVGVGKAKIYCSEDGIKKSCTVTVVQP